MKNERVLHVDVSPTASDEINHNELENTDNKSVQFGSKAIPVTSLDKLTRLLSGRNLWLLNLIRKSEPQSVAELARLSGRPKASLTLTLRRLESFGIIEFREMTGRRKVPQVVCDRLMLEVKLEPVDCAQELCEAPDDTQRSMRLSDREENVGKSAQQSEVA